MTYEDAVTLARYAWPVPGTNGYNTFVDGAMAWRLGEMFR